MSAFNLFEKLHADLVTTNNTIEFNPKWNNGTGYFDNATSERVVLGKPAVASVCPVTDRRLILVKMPNQLGNIVMFERYTPNAGNSDIVVCNAPQEFKIFITSNVLTEQNIKIIWDGYDSDIANFVSNIIEQTA